MKVNSHVYLAKGILKQFSEEYCGKRYIDVISDFESMNIIKTDIETFNTDYGYYSSETEQILNHDCENNIVNLIEKIENCVKNNEKLNYKKHTRYILQYVTFQILRSDILTSKLLNKSKNIIEENEMKNRLINLEHKEKIIRDIVKEYQIENIFYNNSDMMFLLPANGFVMYNDLLWIIIIAPRIAICLHQKEDDIIRKINSLPIIKSECDFQDFIESINKNVVNVGKTIKPHFIVGKYDSTKSIIERLQKTE